MAKAKSTKTELIKVGEVSVSPTLDFSLNKSDLIEILIDEEMERVELILKQVKERRALIQDEIRNEKLAFMQDTIFPMLTAVCSLITKKFLKVMSDDEALRIWHNFSSNYSNIEFNITNDYKLQLRTASAPVHDIMRLISDFEKRLTITYSKEINELNTTEYDKAEYLKSLKKNPGRVKAKLIKNFLSQSASGEQLLALVKKTDLKKLMEGEEE